MAAPILLNASDSYVSEKYPTKNYSSVGKLYLADGSSSDTRYAFIYFGVPSGLFGRTVLNAKLRLYSGGGFTGSVTISVYRVAAKYTNSKVNYTNKPSTTGSAVTVAKTSAASGTMWEFDVTALMQAVANGAAWYGFRISATNSTAKWLYSANGDSQYRPRLEITWSDAPFAPTVLIPDNGQAVSIAKPILQWDFTDPGGDTSMAQFNLRLFGSLANANANTSATLDTTVASDTPQVDLDDTAYGGLSVAATLWWRVRVQDGAGLWSQWSDVASFTRASKGTLTITNPAVAPNNFVTEATPPFSWTFTGATQRAYEVLLSTPLKPAVYIWRSGVTTSTDVAVTPPPGKLTTPGDTYRVTVRIYDTVSRRAVPDDPIYVEATRDFTFDLKNTVTTVTSFTAAPDPYRPKVVLQWNRATAPDFFVILQNGKVIDEVEPSEVFISGTTYRWSMRGPSSRKAHVWSVAAKVNGVVSSGNPTDTQMMKVATTCLADVNTEDQDIFFFNPDVQAAKTESSEVHYLLGNAPPVLITQSIRGYEGTISGVIADNLIPGLDAETQIALIEDMKDNPGKVYRLLWVDKALDVIIYNITHSPIPYPDGKLDHLVSFSFFETDF